MNFDFKLPSALRGRNEFDLSHNHVLSQNFGGHNILSVIELNRGDEVNVDLTGFTRLMPLPAPTYGGVKMIHRAYAVNLEYVIKHFNDFIAYQKVPGTVNYTQPQYASNKQLYIPRFKVSDVITVITSSRKWTTVHAGTEQMVFDFFDYSNNNGYVLTPAGRRLVSWLSQLGYKLPSYTQGAYNDEVYDCLALFAFWKYYLEWVVPARFVLTNLDFVYIRSVIDELDCQNRQYVLKAVPNGQSNELPLEKFLVPPTSFLEDDPYTSAFMESYGVENTSSNLIGSSIQNISGLDIDTNSQDSSVIGNSLIDGSTSDNVAQLIYNNDGSFSQFALLSLGRLQKLVNAKKATSTRVKDFLLNMFGVAPSSDELRMSQYLGSFDSQIMIGDVMSTANTETTQGMTYVGEYAGKGLGGSSAHWKFKSDFNGFLFITCELQVKTSYVNGISVLRQRFDPMAFYQPNFDNIGVRAIKRKELIFNTFEDDHSIDPSELPSPTSIFGFSPRYSEYKFKNDEVTGDFMIPSVNAGLDSWYLSRKFNVDDEPFVGLEFNSASSEGVGSQYDRIFQNTNNDDHFYSTYRIHIKKYASMESLFDYFETIEDERGKSTNVAIN